MRTRQTCVIVIFALALWLGSPAQAGDEPASRARPNILWLSCEDLSPHLGCYGDPVARTPRLDRLAAEGIRFTRAFSVAGVCAPSRSAIITGMYPTTLGTHAMRCRAKLPPWVVPFPKLLREAGYYCTNSSKTDYQFDPPPDLWDESSAAAHWNRRPRANQPFFAVFNYTGTHESAVVASPKRKARAVSAQALPDDAARTLPPYYPDTPLAREEWARYYDCIAGLDDWIEGHLRALDEAGLADQTIVMFWSDHGAGLPRAKRTIYDSGVHVPLIVRVPPAWVDLARGAGSALPDAKTPNLAGTTDDRLVSLLDLAPTVLTLAGVPIPSHFQGQPFLGRKPPPPRDALFLVRDRMDERHDMIRGVRAKRYKYLRNFQPWKPRYQHVEYAEQSRIMQEIRRLSSSGGLSEDAARFAAATKPLEELYDLEADPHELHNLAGEASHRETLAELRAASRAWMLDTRDLGLMPEAEIARREQSLGHRQAILAGPPGQALLAELLNAADIVASRGDQIEPLQEFARASDPALRYWGVLGLARAQPAVVPVAPEVDEAPVVRLALARAWLASGEAARAIPELTRALRGDDPWLALEAALVLDDFPEHARQCTKVLTELAHQKQPSSGVERYAPRVARHLLSKLSDGTRP